MEELYGRDAEREIVLTFVAAAAGGPAQLLIEGEAGIGKTALHRWAVRIAGSSATTVLQCRPTRAEADYAFAALTDLLAPVDEARYRELPEPQREALGAATLRISPREQAVDPRAVGTATGSLLAALASAQPVLLAIDDSQWMDGSSAQVLTFALRRLRDLRVGLLICRRAGEPGGFTTPPASSSDSWRRQLRLRPLGTGALHHIIHQELGVSLSRPQMVPLAETSGGNPFFAVELARADLDRGTAAGDATSLPAPLRTLTAERFGRLSETARRALLATSLARHPDRALLARLGMEAALEEAEAADMVAISDGRVAFTHPLLAAAAQDGVAAHVVRAAHAQLATCADEAELRSRHLALATPEPDATVAAALDEAVLSAQARGAPLAAVELARLAVERTPPGQPGMTWTRTVCLARLLHDSGATDQARAALAGVLGTAPSARQSAEAHLLEVEIDWQLGDVGAARRAAEAAVEDAGDDHLLATRALLYLAEATENADETLRLAVAARETLAAIPDPPVELAAWVIAEEVGARFNVGGGLDRDALDRALALERTGRTARSSDQVATIRPVLLRWSDAHEEAVAALLELRRMALDEGNEGVLPYIAGHLTGSLMRLGRLTEAAEEGALHHEEAEASGQSGQRVQARYNQALVAAHRGRLDDARQWAAEVQHWVEENDDPWMAMSAASALGLVALLSGEVADACGHFDRWHELSVTIGLADPGVSRFHGDHIEAVLGSGDEARAALLTEQLHDAATRTRRISALTVAERCRALLAGVRGDTARALEHIASALDHDRQCPIPLECARILLVQGTIQRRAREKRAARDTLGAALVAFEEMGAGGWAERARAELSRVGLRATSAFALTATEARVAELTAAGLTNKQVAERAFMSPKTVEANLARVYRKLDIASRAELGAAMARREPGQN